MNNLEIQTIKKQLYEKFGFIDEVMLERALKEAQTNNVSFEEISTYISEFELNLNKKPITSSLLSNVLVSEVFHKNDESMFYNSGISGSYSKLPKLGKLFGSLLALGNEKLFNKMLISQSGMYNFANNFDGDIQLKGKLDFEVLRNLNDKGEINLKDLQTNLWDSKNNIIIKNLLLNDDKLIIQSNSSSVNEINSATNYLYSFGLFNALLTKALCESPEKIKGISLVNNADNKEFSVFNFSFDQLVSPKYEKPLLHKGRYYIKDFVKKANDENYTKLLFSPEFPSIVKSIYKDYVMFLVQKYNYHPEINKLEKDEINVRLEKDKGHLIASKDASIINSSKTYEYYKEFNTSGDELSEEEKKFKFIDKPTLSPSQLNSFLWNKKRYNNEFIAMTASVLSKYNLALTEQQIKTLEKILNNEAVIREEISTELQRTTFDEAALTRMNFGNQVEEVILNHFQNVHPELGIKIDKGTLYSKEFNTTFDIDGYVGTNLNNIYQVVEIKNSASPYYFKDPRKIVDSYALQLTYYTHLLKPKKGIKFVAALTSGKQTKLYSTDFIPSEKEEKMFKKALSLSKMVFEVLIENNLFNFNDTINEIKKEKYFKATGKNKNFDVAKELLNKNDVVFERR